MYKGIYEIMVVRFVNRQTWQSSLTSRIQLGSKERYVVFCILIKLEEVKLKLFVVITIIE